MSCRQARRDVQRVYPAVRHPAARFREHLQRQIDRAERPAASPQSPAIDYRKLFLTLFLANFSALVLGCVLLFFGCTLYIGLAMRKPLKQLEQDIQQHQQIDQLTPPARR